MQDWKVLTLLCWVITVGLHIKKSEILQCWEGFKSTRENCISAFFHNPHPNIDLCCQNIAQLSLLFACLGMCLFNVWIFFYQYRYYTPHSVAADG